MITDVLTLLLAAAGIYFLWHWVFKMYHLYYFYTRQGIPAAGFPLPVIGNLLLLKKVQEKLAHSKSIHQEYWN